MLDEALELQAVISMGNIAATPNYLLSVYSKKEEEDLLPHMPRLPFPA